MIDLKNAVKPLLEDKKKLAIVAASFLGIILIVISSVVQSPKKEETKDSTASHEFSESEYTEALEKKLEGMISSLNGAGRTKVIVTLDCDYETVYAKDGKYSQNEKSSDENSEYIIIDSDKAESGLLLKTVTPKVRGVAVLCEGGDAPAVKSAVSDMLSALLDVGVNRISVSKIQ